MIDFGLYLTPKRYATLLLFCASISLTNSLQFVGCLLDMLLFGQSCFVRERSGQGELWLGRLNRTNVIAP